MMHRAFVIGAGLVFLFGPAAYAQNGKELLQACRMVARGMQVRGDAVYIPPSPESNQCWGFIEAVQEFATLADQDGKTLLGSCPGVDTRTTEILHVFIDYGNAHPDKLDLSAAAVAYNAMADAFPCK